MWRLSEDSHERKKINPACQGGRQIINELTRCAIHPISLFSPFTVRCLGTGKIVKICLVVIAWIWGGHAGGKIFWDIDNEV